MKINDWNEQQVARAETTWGHTLNSYNEDLFKFAMESGESYLDLGCGFGRFLEYLTLNHPEPFKYYGYDSSESMVARIKERFPEQANNIFCRSITDPIYHMPEVIVCSAVFVHLPLNDQHTILANIAKHLKPPKAITLDINTLPLKKISCGDRHQERFITLGSSKFRMTWQSADDFRTKLSKMFRDYTIKDKHYSLKTPRQHYKTVFFLEHKI